MLHPAVLLAASLSVATPVGPGPAAPGTWEIDRTHSELTFRIRHLVSRVSGTFTDWSGTVTGDTANWGAGSVRVVIQTRSIDTNNERRDSDLRSSDFFDSEHYPEITFVSTAVTSEAGRLTIVGVLSMKGVSRPVTLTGAYRGFSPGADGRDRVGFQAQTTINRLDYGISWNRAVEGGGMLLGDEVEIDLTIAAVRSVTE